jgi:hypothetical protein
MTLNTTSDGLNNVNLLYSVTGVNLRLLSCSIEAIVAVNVEATKHEFRPLAKFNESLVMPAYRSNNTPHDLHS